MRANAQEPKNRAPPKNRALTEPWPSASPPRVSDAGSFNKTCAKWGIVSPSAGNAALPAKRLSRECMHEDNLPMVLPDGNVYSYRALEALTGADGTFLHPQTGERLRLDQMRKAFFL